jgi:hypothetical protein
VSAVVCALAIAGGAGTLRAQSQQTPPPHRILIDRVIAVVNNQAILASDIDDEIRLSILDPGQGASPLLTRQRALEQLIERALIEQQIQRGDQQTATPQQAEVDARLKEIRSELPICIRENCASEAGWTAFLASHELSAQRVESYLRYRLEILGFIELRFRQGIRIPPSQIESYYREEFVSQFKKGEVIPPRDKVSDRIEEILLERQVNLLFDDWLNSLRSQGEIEILDPSLAAAEPKAEGGAR